MPIAIASVNIPENKNLDIGLSYIFGIGRPLALKIIQEANLNPNQKFKDLKADEIERLRAVIEKNYKTEGELRAEIQSNVRRLKDIGTYRGLRHIKNLPLRGQRTRTNARTKRGKRVTVGSGRKRAAEKT